MGWTIDTWSMSTGTIDEQAFFDDVDATVATDQEMLDGLLGDDGTLYVQDFEFTDRVGHVMWRYVDPEHPPYTAVGNSAGKFAPSTPTTRWTTSSATP